MLGENHAPSMLSYAASGSQYGIGFFLPFILLTFTMAYVAQEITVRLGAVSQAGHADLIYRRFGRFWGNFTMVDLIFTKLPNINHRICGNCGRCRLFWNSTTCSGKWRNHRHWIGLHLFEGTRHGRELP